MGRNSLYSGRELTRGKTWSAILYPDATNYSCDEVLKNIMIQAYKYAYILHNEDIYTQSDLDNVIDETMIGEPKKAHFHVVFFWDNVYQLGYIANRIGLPSQYLQKTESRSGAIQYLIHKNNPEKHQYSISEITTNIEKIQSKFFSDDDCIMKASKLIDYITTFKGPLTITAVCQWSVFENCYDEFRRGQHLFTSIIKEHNDYYERTKQ